MTTPSPEGPQERIARLSGAVAEAVGILRGTEWTTHGAECSALDCAVELSQAFDEALARLSAPPPSEPQDCYRWGKTMPQYVVLGIGPEAWVELQDAEKRLTRERGVVTLKERTFRTLMDVLRAIRLRHFRPEPPSEAAAEPPDQQSRLLAEVRAERDEATRIGDAAARDRDHWMQTAHEIEAKAEAALAARTAELDAARAEIAQLRGNGDNRC